MKHLRLFENFDQPELNEGAIKNLVTMIDATDGDADLDPGTQWTPEEAIEWGVGFEKEYGLWHPDEDARDIIWDDNNKPKNLVKADKQMENFSNVDWKASDLGADLDQYVIVKFIKDAIKAGSLQESQLVDKHGNKWSAGNTIASKNIDAIVKLIKPVAYWSTGSGGGFYHEFFLMDDGTAISFHYATGYVYASEKKYTKEDFHGESEFGFDTPLGDDFEADTQDEKRDLLSFEVENFEEGSTAYRDKEFTDVEGIASRIKNKEYIK